MYTLISTKDLGGSIYTDDVDMPEFVHVAIHKAENLTVPRFAPVQHLPESGTYVVSARSGGFGELALFTKDPMALVATLRGMADALEAQVLWDNGQRTTEVVA
jgi:hypothetical protein